MLFLPQFLSLALAAESEYHVEASTQLLPETAALDLRFRMDGKRDAYLLGAMRVDPTGCFVGRAGIGFDVFGGAEGFDLKLGLFLGGVGDVEERALYGRPAAGGEVQIGAKIGRIYGFFRHMDGFAGPLEDRLTEDELRVGFKINDHWRLHGQGLVLDPAKDAWDPSVGIGVETIW